MEDLLRGFQGTFSVTLDINDTSKPHPRFSDFKFKREGYGDQEFRRQKVMEDQKSRRRDYLDYARRVVEGEVFSDEEDNNMEEGGFDEVDGKGAAQSRRISRNPYRNQLMLSEWLVDVPVDFESKWFMVVCPVAKRCLIISHNGKTYAYSRTGHFFKQFSSWLPGGHLNASNYGKNNYCILDCLFHEGQQTFYVLDIMCWGGHPVYDSDTEFRFFWLHSKLADIGSDLQVQSRSNPYKFVPLQSCSCAKEIIAEVLKSSPLFEVDGLLFFHKEGHYFRGHSPIVLWLKPHMVPEILKIPVSDEFLACVPIISNDVSMDTDKTGSQAKKKNKKKSTPKSSSMDVEDTDGVHNDDVITSSGADMEMTN